MVNVFDYLDYRKFLKAWFEEKKRENPRYSFRVLADQAGFKSKSFIAHVMEGKANLSDNSLFALGKALKLSAKEFAYCESLVRFNQARDQRRREECFRELAEKSGGAKARIIMEHEYEFYSKWYHNTVRELVTMVDFNEDYAALGRLLVPSISAVKARRSVALLMNLGLIEKKNGKYVQTDKVLRSGDDIVSVAVTSFHLQNLDISREAVSRFPAGEREISCVVGGMSGECFKKVKDEIQQFRKRIVAMISGDDSKARRVYHVNFQLFPTAVTNDKE
jgi:uncharacterized protein (TIGR02147 family)